MDQAIMFGYEYSVYEVLLLKRLNYVIAIKIVYFSCNKLSKNLS